MNRTQRCTQTEMLGLHITNYTFKPHFQQKQQHAAPDSNFGIFTFTRHCANTSRLEGECVVHVCVSVTLCVHAQYIYMEIFANHMHGSVWREVPFARLTLIYSWRTSSLFLTVACLSLFLSHTHAHTCWASVLLSKFSKHSAEILESFRRKPGVCVSPGWRKMCAPA